jgi:hypothetical protein
VWGSTAIAGEVRYRPQCVNYLPAYKVKYKIDTIETTAVFDTVTFNRLKEAGGFSSYVILNPQDSVKEDEPEDKELYDWLGEVDAVRVGKWRWYNFETNKSLVDVEYDDCSNPIKVTRYDEKGNIRDVRTYPSAPKRIRKK